MRWVDSPSTKTVKELSNYHPLISRKLIQRGISSVEAAQAFLDPDEYQPEHALSIPGMDQAVERIARAIQSGESICVWGDFDVDGQTATTVLVQTLSALGANVTFHIPVRARESHGLNIPNLDRIIKDGTSLVLTCDTGISAHKAVDYACEQGVDIVITDHHDLPPELPRAAAVTNPKLLPGSHPLATLPGVGVAYKLAEALIERVSETDFQVSSLLDLVALGIVADVALLQGDVRYLLQMGLRVLKKTERLGLLAMMDLAELVPDALTEEHIGFVLGPRMNALGRLDDANPSVDLLTTKDNSRAKVLATIIEGLNAQRQLMCNQVYLAAEAQLKADPKLLGNPILILQHEKWPGGIIGIVASRLAERYQRPTILLSTPQDGPARGSARSVAGINITEAIAKQKDLLLNFGGHPMAAGISINHENIKPFQKRINQTISRLEQKPLEDPNIEIDGWFNLAELDLELAGEIEKLAPFGPGNKKPILAARNLTLRSSTVIGRNKEHRKFVVDDENGNSQEVLWWDGASELIPEGPFDLAFTLRASNYRGNLQTQLEFIDFRPLKEPSIEIRSREIELVDFRSEENPKKLLKQLKSDILIWAEGQSNEEIKGVTRTGLHPVKELAIWTTPPGKSELQSALELVKPEKVYLFANNPATDDFENFLTRLAGLVKFAINQREGSIVLSELAGAMAQSEKTVRKGLVWLAARGITDIHEEPLGRFMLTNGDKGVDASKSSVLASEIQSLLSEAVAFRKFYVNADGSNLIKIE